MSTTAHAYQAHAEAEQIWALNFSDRPTEEFAGLSAVCECEQRHARLRAKLPAEYEFLQYHLASLRGAWDSVSVLHGAENTGTRCGQYDKLVALGLAERKIEPLFDECGRERGFRIYFRQAQEREARP